MWQKKEDIEKKMARNKKKTALDWYLLLLEELPDEDTSIYLDELTLSFGIIAGKHTHQRTV